MKVAIVGAGHVAQQHLAYIARTQQVRLVAICDKNEIRASDFARQFGVPHYTELPLMLSDSQPDIVHILTPPQTHAALAIQALEAQCHVLVEKPLCLTGDEASAIYAAAESAGRLVSVDHNHLWSPLVQRARRVIESGQLGQVLHIQYLMGDDFLDMVNQGYSRWALDLRGGIFCDLIPHPLYLIGALFRGAHVVAARSRGTSISDLRELWVDFAADSASASLWMSLNQRPLEHNLRIYCEKGTVHVDLRNFCLAVVPERGLPGPMARLVNTISESRQRGLGTLLAALGLVTGRFDAKAGTAGAIRAFYQAIAQGKPAPVSREEATAVVGLSNVIWDELESTPKAISPVVDKTGRVVVRRVPADFAQSAGNVRPRVLITGGTGLIGSHLVRRLVANGQMVRVLCRNSSSVDQLPCNGVDLAIADVGDPVGVRRAMDGIEILYHLAAAMNGDWATQYHSTVLGTRNVFAAAAEAGVKKAVHVSSLGVLQASGFPNGGIVDESFPLEKLPEARGPYSRAKLDAEHVATEFVESGRLSICILRPGLVYGSSQKKFLSDAGFRVGEGFLLVVGLGRRRLGLTHVENLVDALLLAGENENSCGKTYHIVDPDQPTVRQYIRAYSQATDQNMTAIYVPTAFWAMGFGLLDQALRSLRGSSPNLSYRLRSIAKGPRFDTAAARERLGWQARVSFEQGFAKEFHVALGSVGRDSEPER